MPDGLLYESLVRYIGRTVTIFTTSGGISGAGFTGVLAAVTPCVVKLITDVGAAPACPVGSSCECECGNGCGNYGAYGYGNGYGYGYGYGYNGYGYNNGYNGCGCGCNSGCSSCCNSCGNGCGGFSGNNWLGSVTEIPVDHIASFTHNAI